MDTILLQVEWAMKYPMFLGPALPITKWIGVPTRNRATLSTTNNDVNKKITSS